MAGCEGLQGAELKKCVDLNALATATKRLWVFGMRAPENSGRSETAEGATRSPLLEQISLASVADRARELFPKGSGDDGYLRISGYRR